ncbi:MAG: thioredoxin family protein [Pseudomonadota bacterium]
MLLDTPATAMGTPPPPFTLKDAQGRAFSSDDVMGKKGLLVAFICNHCPYVVDVMPRLAEDVPVLEALGVGVICINANDYTAYPADAPDKMPGFAAQFGLTAPYVVDEDQTVARAYGAVCTPDFFGYGVANGLQYRGRLDNVGMRRDPAGRAAELVAAMALVTETRTGPADQTPSMGCSIKWKG